MIFGSTLFVKSIIQENAEIVIQLELQSNDTTVIQLFFNDGRPFTKAKMQLVPCYPNPNFQKVFFRIPKSYDLKNIRFDLGATESNYKIRSLVLADRFNSLSYSPLKIRENFEPNNYISLYEYDQVNNVLNINTYAGDPYIIIDDLKDKFDILRINYLIFILLINISLWIEIAFYILILIHGHSLKRLRKGFLHFDYRKWFSITFVALLFSPFLIQTLDLFRTTENMENRHLAEYPDIEETGFADFLGAYSDYFGDNFGLRTQMIALNNLIHFSYLDEAASNRNVEIGSDTWLYVSAYLQSAYFVLFGEDDLNAIKNTLSERGEYLANLGIKYYLLIPPTKASAYKEFRPKFYKKFNELPPGKYLRKVL
jgi:hypothetical protein